MKQMKRNEPLQSEVVRVVVLDILRHPQYNGTVDISPCPSSQPGGGKKKTYLTITNPLATTFAIPKYNVGMG